MATTAVLRRRALVPILLATGLALTPISVLHADAPELPVKKSIYDDLPTTTTSSSSRASATSLLASIIPSSLSPPSSPSTTTTSLTPASSPSTTGMLASHIRSARLFLHAHVAAGESHLNSMLSSLLHLESSFTSTIASLAPPRSSGERLMPGAIYVLVAAMTGSIISRNRNIVLRATVPLAIGLGAGWVVLPLTMRNVGDLVWRLEEKAPLVAENHLRIRGATEEAWRLARERGNRVFEAVDEGIRRERERAEEWVRRGK